MLLMCLTPVMADDETVVKVGDVAPLFKTLTTDGQVFDLAAHKGKPVVVAFISSVSRSSNSILPLLEQEIWWLYSKKGLILIGIGREDKAIDLAQFKKDEELTFFLGEDPRRDIFNLYASSVLPRCYLIDPTGKVVFSTVGYDEAEFDKMKKLIDEMLVAPK